MIASVYRICVSIVFALTGVSLSSGDPNGDDPAKLLWSSTQPTYNRRKLMTEIPLGGGS